VAVYSVNRRSRPGVSKVEKSIQSIQVYKESASQIALYISIKKGTDDGEWEIRVQSEKVSSVKSIKFLGLHLNLI
jgi:hypothetical protein